MQSSPEVSQYYDEEDRIVHINVFGEGYPEFILPMYQAAKDLAEQNKTNKLLFNFTNFSISYDIQEVVRVTKELAFMVEGFKIARLVNFSEFRHDLIEEVSLELPFKLKNFINTNEALNWLRV